MQAIWILSKMIVSMFQAIDHVSWIIWDIVAHDERTECHFFIISISECCSDFFPAVDAVFVRFLRLACIKSSTRSEIYVIPVQFLFFLYFVSRSLSLFADAFLQLRFKSMCSQNQIVCTCSQLIFYLGLEKALCKQNLVSILMKSTARYDVN